MKAGGRGGIERRRKLAEKLYGQFGNQSRLSCRVTIPSYDTHSGSREMKLCLGKSLPPVCVGRGATAEQVNTPTPARIGGDDE